MSLDKVNEESVSVKMIDERFKGIVKGLFNCGISVEVKQILAKANEKLRELNI